MMLHMLFNNHHVAITTISSSSTVIYKCRSIGTIASLWEYGGYLRHAESGVCYSYQEWSGIEGWQLLHGLQLALGRWDFVRNYDVLDSVFMNIIILGSISTFSKYHLSTPCSYTSDTLIVDTESRRTTIPCRQRAHYKPRAHAWRLLVIIHTAWHRSPMEKSRLCSVDTLIVKHR